MKVCILATIYPRYEGDFSGIFVHRLAKSLVKRGIEVYAVVPHAKGIKKEEMMDGVYVHRFQYMYPQSLQTLAYFPGIPENIKRPFNKLQLLPFALSMTRKMMGVIKKYDIEIINAHWALPSGFLATMSKRIHRLPVVTTLYGAELFIVRRKYSIFKPLLKRAISNSDKVIAISDATADAAKNIATRKEVEIIPDGVDTEHFSPEISGDEIKRRYSLEGYQVILSCGRMVERKGFEYLIRAMPAVIEKLPNTKLILIGEGPEKAKQSNLTSNLGVDGSIIFSGVASDEDLPKYYAACDVYVLPSIIDSRGDTEGSGTTLVEAMASGKPVIGTNVGGIPYAVHNGEEGFLVEQRSPSQLAERIITLLSDQSLRQEFGKRGRKATKEQFSWDKIAERYSREFEKLMKDG